MMDVNRLRQETLLYPLDCLILACAQGHDALSVPDFRRQKQCPLPTSATTSVLPTVEDVMGSYPSTV
jgi:hypothetical protein